VIGEKRAALVKHGGDGFFPERTRPPGERVVTKIEDGWVLDVSQEVGAVRVLPARFGWHAELRLAEKIYPHGFRSAQVRALHVVF
jgi:hypothetical protein